MNCTDGLSANEQMLCEKINELDLDLNTVFLLFCSINVFMMHFGFAMLSAGLVRSKNVINMNKGLRR